MESRTIRFRPTPLRADERFGIPSTVTMNQPDARQELVKALVATGREDRAAFRQLYALTSAKLFGICLRICRERQAAEDVLQEVYAIIWRRAGAYEPGQTSPFAWLATIARNRAIDYHRALGRRPTAPLDNVAEPAASERLALESMLLDEGGAQTSRLHGPPERNAARRHPDGLFRRHYLCRARRCPRGSDEHHEEPDRRGLERLKECLDDDI